VDNTRKKQQQRKECDVTVEPQKATQKDPQANQAWRSEADEYPRYCTKNFYRDYDTQPYEIRTTNSPALLADSKLISTIDTKTLHDFSQNRTFLAHNVLLSCCTNVVGVAVCDRIQTFKWNSDSPPAPRAWLTVISALLLTISSAHTTITLTQTTNYGFSVVFIDIKLI